MGQLQRRLLHLAVVLFVVTFATFAMVNLLPGDVSLAILGHGATPEGVARVRLELGLNDPLWLRYVHWLVADGSWRLWALLRVRGACCGCAYQKLARFH